MDYNIFLMIIIGSNLIFSLKGFSDANFFRQNMFNIGSIRAGEQSRMISSAFLHANIPHLAFNMIALFSFAPVVIMYLGNFSFLLIYFVSLIFGSLLTLMLHKNDLNYTAVGASGAVTGIIYSSILLYPDLKVSLFFIPIGIPGYLFGILYLLYSIYGMKAKNDGIGHSAHFGGAIGGFAITLLKNPDILTQNTSLVIMLAVPIVIMFIMLKTGKL